MADCDIHNANRIIKCILKASKIPGISVSVVKKGKVILSEGFGIKKYGNEQDLVTSKTLFEIGSCTKTFIAVALSHFVDSEEITWQTTVISILPWFNTPDQYLTANMTIEDLLAHRTGYATYSGDLLFGAGVVNTELDIVKQSKYLSPIKTLRYEFLYNNIGYEIATIVLEALCKTTWTEYVKNKIFIPLGMHSTVASINFLKKEDTKKMTYGNIFYYDPNLKTKIISQNYFNPKTPKLYPSLKALGAGSIISNAEDYAKFMLYLLDSKRTLALKQTQMGHMIVPESWIYTLTQTPVNLIGNPYATGLGFDVVGPHIDKNSFYTKGGNTLFCSTRTGFLPQKSLGVVVMSNIRNDPTINPYLVGLCNAMLSLFLGNDTQKVLQELKIIETSVKNIKKDLNLIYPLKTLIIPMRNGPNLKFNYRNIFSLSDLRIMIDRADDGLPPLDNPNRYIGMYKNKYYKTVELTLTNNNQLYLKYGTLIGTLCRLNNEFPQTFICPLGMRTSFFFTLQFTPIIINKYKDKYMINILDTDFYQI